MASQVQYTGVYLAPEDNVEKAENMKPSDRNDHFMEAGVKAMSQDRSLLSYTDVLTTLLTGDRQHQIHRSKVYFTWARAKGEFIWGE
ncbi:hypothetical protein XELAEV_18043223mg [Xenopus laevis]|uniref:Uncharacterized protein n=1 Tax=Xenopus laevis TaxID=8355 RepID=A0A974BW78_XENLA|nr:hypothetical protein XELAEV_18043223mg [Xenopus laevis]